MRNRGGGNGGLVALVLSGASGPRRGSGRTGSPGRARGLELDRRDREGRGPGGQPLHPTLRRLWDAVDASGHAVYVELPDPKGRRSYVAGRFAVTKVDPEGKAHEATSS